jgi:hypothetical protein
MIEKRSVFRIIEEVESERIVLVTSANWAKTLSSAKNYIDGILLYLAKRKSSTLVTIRVSVDTEHTSSIGLDPIVNLIGIFIKYNKLMPELELQIHSLDGDPCIDTLILELGKKHNISRKSTTSKRISDGKNAIKIVPKQEIVTIDGLSIKVGYAQSLLL